MAETSGFATDLPQSAYLAHTIRRAISVAEQRSHRYVTLEHLLLALLDDSDGLVLMEVARTDVSALRLAATETVNHNLATLYTPGTFDLHASYKVERVLQSASDDARSTGCSEVDGAFVVVALFHETDSPAYELLKRHNFVFHAAITWIDRNRGAPKPKYAPPPPPLIEAPRQPEPRTAMPASSAADDQFDEPDSEILLDEIIEEDDLDRPVPARKPATPAGLPPFFRQRIEQANAAPAGYEAQPVAGRAEGAPWQPGSLPPRSASANGPDFGAAVPRRDPAHSRGREMAPGRPSRDPGDLSVPGRDRQGADRAPAPGPRLEGEPAERLPAIAEADDRAEQKSQALQGQRRASPASRPEAARAEPHLPVSTDVAETDGLVTRTGERLAFPASRPEAPSTGQQLQTSVGSGAIDERGTQSRERRSGPGSRAEAARVEPHLSAAPGSGDMAEQDWQSDERREEPGPNADGIRTEPRLPTSIDRGRGLGAATPGGQQPDFTEGQEFRQRFDPPGPAPGHDLGSAIPARDVPLMPGRPMDTTESRPSRPHATARERSSTVTRQPGPVEGDASPQNGVPPRNGGSAGREEDLRPAQASVPPRSEADLPGAHRLDNMRVRPNAAPQIPPVPASRPAGKKAAAREKESDKARSRRRPSPAAVYTGKLAENIPRKMRAFKAERVEVRVTREETESFLSGFEGSMEAFRHDLLVTQAMSVMLRSPDGGFTVENLGPETQWIFNGPDITEKEPFGRWRWAVMPTETGSQRLQLIVAARSVDQNGLAGDTALPDQVIAVNVRANYGRSIARAAKWVVLMALGGVITEGALQLMRLFGKG